MESIRWILLHLYNFFSGLIFAFAGYFAPVKGVIHVMIAAIVIDLLTGIKVAHMRGEGIKSSKLWRTGYKMLISIAIVFLTFSLDREMGVVEIHKFVAWLIVGFEIWSILENAGKMTDHKLFRILKKFMEEKVKETTGINLEEDNEVKSSNNAQAKSNINESPQRC